MSKIIVLTGPESTGKSSLSKLLASHFNCQAYEEYARSYLEELGNSSYSYTDVEKIAIGQVAQYEKAREQTSQIVILDTWLIITKVWFQWVYGKEPDWLESALQTHAVDLYLLCYPDLEWESDPLRENGGDKRNELFEAYRAELDGRGLRYVVIRGIGEKRLQNAIDAIEKGVL